VIVIVLAVGITLHWRVIPEYRCTSVVLCIVTRVPTAEGPLIRFCGSGTVFQ